MAWNKSAAGGPPVFLGLLSAGLVFFNLSVVGWGNPYYAAGVSSMLRDGKDFFFLPYDPHGFITIDKPALGYWIQGFSGWIFGPTAFAFILPQCLAGIAAVLLLFWAVKQRRGSLAGFLAGLSLALTPLFVQMARFNNIDELLTLCFVGVFFLFLKAVKTGRIWYLLAAFAFVGIGFNIKMIEVLIVVPALVLGTLLGFPRLLWVRIAATVSGLLLAGLLSMTWILTVDATKTSQRPWVDGTIHNSESELALGYNGIGRLGMNSGTTPQKVAASHGYQNDRSGNSDPFISPRKELGRALRLTLGSNSAWFFIPAFAAIVWLVWRHRRSLNQLWEDHVDLFFLAVWLLTGLALFSQPTTFFLAYYLVVLTPAYAGLTGWALAGAYRRAPTSQAVWIVLFLLFALVAEIVLSLKVGTRVWPGFWVGLGTLMSGIVVAVAVRRWAAWRVPLVSLATALVFVLPLVSSLTLWLPDSPNPSEVAFRHQEKLKPKAGSFVDIPKLSALVRTQNRPGMSWALAVPSIELGISNALILEGIPVMALGGFTGLARPLSLGAFQDLVRTGRVRYAVSIDFASLDALAKTLPMEDRAPWFGMDYESNADILAWVVAHGRRLPDAVWKLPEGEVGPFEKAVRDAYGLYDLGQP